MHHRFIHQPQLRVSDWWLFFLFTYGEIITFVVVTVALYLLDLVGFVLYKFIYLFIYLHITVTMQLIIPVVQYFNL